eukprot:3695271-Lingulodinium_polyedra.AAC.1
MENCFGKLPDSMHSAVSGKLSAIHLFLSSCQKHAWPAQASRAVQHHLMHHLRAVSVDRTSTSLRMTCSLPQRTQPLKTTCWPRAPSNAWPRRALPHARAKSP